MTSLHIIYIYIYIYLYIFFPDLVYFLRMSFLELDQLVGTSKLTSLRDQVPKSVSSCTRSSSSVLGCWEQEIMSLSLFSAAFPWILHGSSVTRDSNIS
jgi:hypothetical protein